MAFCCSGIAKLLGATQNNVQMPKKFTYFALKTPVGMPSMCIWEVSGKPFEGKAVNFEEWEALKPKTPNGQLPFADMPDGSVICESGAIGRTIAGAACMLGQGKDFTTSEMLVGMASDMNKDYFAIAPTVMNVKDFDRGKKAAFVEGKEKILNWCTKMSKFLLPGGDRFTKSGMTYGEIHLFCLLHCISNGAMPEVASGELKGFYSRMAEVPGIKRVVEGKSKFGDLGTYLCPLPN
jgi:hypothetical protein